MDEAIYEMTRKSLGLTVVTGRGGVLLGVISDGDLRRMLQKSADPLKLTAGEVMSRNPKTISEDELATVALGAARVVAGVVHVHDLWRTEMF